ncbi:MAG: InlB B-repeat-containing protein [Anaeroplasmataceae bacterium]|nr:InlB B-repeat-containing protein [Anaeroplasmataceae bacterium]
MKKLILFLILCVMSITFLGCTQSKAYDVMFDINGHGVQPEGLTDITELPKLPSLEEEGYHFAGWYFDETFQMVAEEGIVITEDKTLYALWEKLYSVEFETNGHGAKPDTIKNLSTLPKLTDLEEEGFLFLGWYLDKELTKKATEGTLLHEDIKLYAKWEEIIKTYEVSFENNGFGSVPEKLTKVTQLPGVLPNLSEEGYQFEGWFLDEALETPATPKMVLEKDTTLYAKWTKLYNIKFEAFGHGDGVEEIKNVLSLPKELPVLEEEGYQFEGWFLDEKFTLSAKPEEEILKDVTLYAKWTKLYHISFETYAYGDAVEEIKNILSIPKELPVLEEESYEFAGWFLDEDFSIPAVPGTPLEEDTTLYARWELEGYKYINVLDEATKKNLSVDGYAQYGITDFTEYWNTAAYRRVSTPLEFLTALVDAKYDYTNTWNEENKTVEQTLNKAGSVHVIEIMNDLNLGYFKLGAQEKATNLVTDFASKMNNLSPYLCMSDMLKENGISQIKVENTSNLLIYSKSGVKITHCGFKLTSDTNVVFRNLSFDELWQWEDAPVNTSSKIGDYDWFGWAYFKIAFCGFIWIDHCTFGKSYDGQIDYSNPVYNANAGTAFRAPYGATGENGLHISWCQFNSGSDDKDGYLYKMMAQIEAEYQEGKKNYLYYNALRDANISFEDILYGIAIPQKKGFLLGDDAKFSGSYENADDYNFNLKLKVSFSNCIFKNIEDRLPKLRGGNAYLYNCLVDSSQYYTYRAKLTSQGAKTVVTRVKSDWKCALVSQGIVCGNGGSVKAENTIFRGIDTLLKHNDTKNVSPYVDGGFELTNCSYQKGTTDSIYIGSSSDTNTKFVSSIPSKLNTNNFSWKTENNQPPFQITSITLEDLEQVLNAYCGISNEIAYMLLKCKYE